MAVDHWRWEPILGVWVFCGSKVFIIVPYLTFCKIHLQQWKLSKLSKSALTINFFSWKYARTSTYCSFRFRPHYRACSLPWQTAHFTLVPEMLSCKGRIKWGFSWCLAVSWVHFFVSCTTITSSLPSLMRHCKAPQSTQFNPTFVWQNLHHQSKV